MGGYDGQSRLSSVECYDSFSNRWTEVAPMKEAVSSPAVASCAGKLFVIGGGPDDTTCSDKVRRPDLLLKQRPRDELPEPECGAEDGEGCRSGLARSVCDVVLMLLKCDTRTQTYSCVALMEKGNKGKRHLSVDSNITALHLSPLVHTCQLLCMQNVLQPLKMPGPLTYKNG